MLALPTASSGEQRNQPSEWEGTQTLRRERHAHRWPSLVRGAMLALPMRSSKSGELIPQSEGTQTPKRERHAHKWPSMVRGAMLARPTRRATYHRALESGELIRQNERETQTLRRERPAHRWPSRWGEQCKLDQHKLWRAENSFLRMRGNLDAQTGAVCS